MAAWRDTSNTAQTTLRKPPVSGAEGGFSKHVPVFFPECQLDFVVYKTPLVNQLQ